MTCEALTACLLPDCGTKEEGGTVSIFILFDLFVDEFFVQDAMRGALLPVYSCCLNTIHQFFVQDNSVATSMYVYMQGHGFVLSHWYFCVHFCKS